MIFQYRVISQKASDEASNFNYLFGCQPTICINVVCNVLSRSVVSDSLQPHGLQFLCPCGFSRQEYWSGLLCPHPGYLPNPGIKPRSPALQADSLPSEPPGKPINCVEYTKLFLGAEEIVLKHRSKEGSHVSSRQQNKPVSTELPLPVSPNHQHL